MPIDDEAPKEAGNTVDPAGESTHFREHSPEEALIPPKRRSTDAYFSTKSIRVHNATNRGGLAMRLALPVLATLIVGLIAILLIAHSRLSLLQREDLRHDAANAAFSTGVFGRVLITHHRKFMDEHPDYAHQAEWKTGDHWLVAQGFVSPGDWVQATGFQLDEYAPISILEKAAEATVLDELTDFLNSSQIDSEVVAVFILAADDSTIASSRKASFRFEPSALRAIPLPEEFVQAGGSEIYAQYLENASPEPMARGVVRIMDHDYPDRSIGISVAVVRSQRGAREEASILLLLAGLALLLTLAVALACWYSTRRITRPMRRLAADMQAIAEGDYERRAGVREADELGLLAQAFNSMSERLRVAHLNEKETTRLESDLAIARDIQNNLLPPQTPRVRGLDIFTSYRPAKEIGGDYYDFLPVDDRHMGLVVADASGKSIPAALVMSTTRAVLRFVAPGNASAAETLTRVNSILSVDIPKGMFVTAYYVILDPLGSTMLCASAGHTPLLIARGDGSVEMLNPGGIALGFDPGPIFQRSIREQRVKLEPGDRVLLYTDGVVECVNTANEEYSDRRLREFLRRKRELSSHDFVGALMADLERHRGAAEMHDDTTIVTFRVI